MGWALLLGEICFRKQITIGIWKSLAVMGVLLAGLFVMSKIQKNIRCFFRNSCVLLLGFIVLNMGYQRMEFVTKMAEALKAFCQEAEVYVISGEIVSKGRNYIRLEELVIKEKQSGVTLYLKQDCCVQVYLTKAGESQEIVGKLGQRVQLEGEAAVDLEPKNEGGFHQRQYYYGLGVYGIFYGKEESLVITDNSYHKGKECLQTLRDSMKRQLYAMTGEKEASILGSILLGDRELLDEDTSELYQLAGIAHVLSISGLHVSVVGMCIYRLLRKRWGFLLSVSGAGAVVLAFGIMTGNGISTRRAVIMFLVFMGGELAGRTYDILTGLALSAIFILWKVPYAMLGTSMQLSFGAVFGIVLTEKWCQSFLTKKNKILQSFAMSEGINMIIRPVLVNSYYQIATLSTGLNILVLPVFSIILYGGFISVFLSYFSIGLGRLVLKLPILIISFYEVCCELYLKIPYSVLITGNWSRNKIMVYYGVCLLGMGIVFFINNKSARWISILTMYLFLTAMPWFGRRPGDCVKMIDVGQGDGIYLETREGLQMLIDGGSSSQEKVGHYTLLPFLKYNRVRELEYVLVSHTDEDHVSGILELLEQRFVKIQHLILPDIPASMRDAWYRKLEEAARTHGCRVLYFSAGMGISQKDFQLMCIFPDKDIAEEDFIEKKGKQKAWDKNELSLVCQVTISNTRFLFTGDLGVQGEEWLLKQQRITPVEVLKVGHHGSRNSSSQEFLDMLSPQLGIISCGKNNRYGHPGLETLQRLEQAGCQTACTMSSGEIMIWIRDKGMEIEMWNMEASNRSEQRTQNSDS